MTSCLILNECHLSKILLSNIYTYIFDNPEMLTTYDKNDRDDFEISLNLQEIIFHILATNQLGKIYKLRFHNKNII